MLLISENDPFSTRNSPSPTTIAANIEQPNVLILPNSYVNSTLPENEIVRFPFTSDEITTHDQIKDKTMQTYNTDIVALTNREHSKNSESVNISSKQDNTGLISAVNPQCVLTKNVHIPSEITEKDNEFLDNDIEMEHSSRENQNTIPETVRDLKNEHCENSNMKFSDIEYDKDTCGNIKIEQMDTSVSETTMTSVEQHCDSWDKKIDTRSDLAETQELMTNEDDKTRDSGICLTRPNSPIVQNNRSPIQELQHTSMVSGDSNSDMEQSHSSTIANYSSDRQEIYSNPLKDEEGDIMEEVRALVTVPTTIELTAENQMTEDNDQNNSTFSNTVSTQLHMDSAPTIKSTMISTDSGDIKEAIKIKIHIKSCKRNKTKKEDSVGKKRQKKSSHKTRNDEEIENGTTPEETKQNSEMDKDSDKTNMSTGESDVDKPGHSKNTSQRKDIRKVKSLSKLEKQTKEAQKIERERRKRIEEKQKKYNNLATVGEKDDVADEDRYKVPVTTECILEADTDGNTIVEVDKTLVRKLKPHQVEAVRFMYDSCIESVQRLEEDLGSGCIIAHCMGLGKTLSVIAFAHTVLSHRQSTNMSTCLVVCPRNTVLNWHREFTMWQADLPFKIKIYELAKQANNKKRAEILEQWYECGNSLDTAAVMIIGYEMYRNLLRYNKHPIKLRDTFVKTLQEPGPDLVVCDEGHVLRNKKSILSDTMCNIKTKRRIALTGTPLQNNLEEYHCMVNFVKTNYLGTSKEFKNQFVNPIKNGQCSDSTNPDVGLMKKRAYILHRMLDGFIQRKDYGVLKDYLPPKHEYVISVRLSSIQIDLYRKYFRRGFNKRHLFKHFQTLTRVWTHPWVLKLHQERHGAEQTDDANKNSLRKMSTLERDVDDGVSTCVDNYFPSQIDSHSDHKLNGSHELHNHAQIAEETKHEERDYENHTVVVDNSDSDIKHITDDLKNKTVKRIPKTYSVLETGDVVKNISNVINTNDNESYDAQSNIQSPSLNSLNTQHSEVRLKSDPLETCTQHDTHSPPYAPTFMIQDSPLTGGTAIYEDISDADDDIIETFPEELNENSLDLATGIEDNNSGSVWWDDLVHDEAFDIKLSGKLSLLFQILQMCDDIGDKILVFSQSLLTLDIIELFLRGQTQRHNNSVSSEKIWDKGVDYFRLDGSTNPQQRKTAQDTFNEPDNHRARLFLISTKAGCLGINLVAANRVVIMDACWNPSHDIQAIFRSYRFGQTKPVYIYRLIAQGTMEEKIYERQVTKQSLAKRVVDEHQIERHFSRADLDELYSFNPDILDDPDRQERPLPALPKDLLLKELHARSKEWICYFHEHDSLLENVTEQELSESEKAAAWSDYERSRGKGNFSTPNELILDENDDQQGANSPYLQEGDPDLALLEELIKEDTVGFNVWSPSSLQIDSLITAGAYYQSPPSTSLVENNNLPLKKRPWLFDVDAFSDISTLTPQDYHQTPANPRHEAIDTRLHVHKENNVMGYPDVALDLSLQEQSTNIPSITSQPSPLPILDYIPVPVCAEQPPYSVTSSISPSSNSSHNYGDNFILDYLE